MALSHQYDIFQQAGPFLRINNIYHLLAQLYACAAGSKPIAQSKSHT
jgi:hypothetical protein